MGETRAQLPDVEMRSWISRNEGGIDLLIRWQLAHTYASQIMAASVMAGLRPGVNNGKPQDLHVVRSPQHHAIGWANWAVARALGYDEVSWMPGHIWAAAVASKATSWPAPPYEL